MGSDRGVHCQRVQAAPATGNLSVRGQCAKVVITGVLGFRLGMALENGKRWDGGAQPQNARCGSDTRRLAFFPSL